MTAILRAEDFTACYGGSPALRGINLEILPNEIFGIIGPAGGGKTTFLRSLNRLNDLDPGFQTEGRILFRGIDLYRQSLDVALLRRKLGMVFAVPVPLPGSIRENLRLGPRFHGRTQNLESDLERCLRAAFLWEEVKDRLDQPAQTLSGGQQQRLCLARTLMMDPEVLLLDEPCSGLDPISTARIEEALREIKRERTVVLVTNNVMQASRAADRTAFFLEGRLVECGPTQQIFMNPKEPVTHEYISGRFG